MRLALSPRDVAERAGQWDLVYLGRMTTSVGVTAALMYFQLGLAYQGGENPWSLLALVCPVGLYLLAVAWTFRQALPGVLGLVVVLLGGVLPFALIG